MIVTPSKSMHQIKTGYSIPCIHVAGSQTQQGDVDAAISTEFTPGPYVTEQFYGGKYMTRPWMPISNARVRLCTGFYFPTKSPRDPSSIRPHLDTPFQC